MHLSTYLDDFTRRDWQESEQGTVRIALVGMGWWTREFAVPAIEASEFCEAAVAVSGSPENTERAIEEHETIGHGITYEEFHDGAAREAYDAVYICTPNALHLEHVEAAAELGKDVLCEKPMEASAERAERMVEACENSVTLMIAYRMRTDPAARRARELVEDGVIGEPAFVHSHMSQRLLEIIPNPDQWRLDPDLAGPGTSVTDLGIYSINTTRFVTGRDPVRAAAMMHADDDAFDDVPDEHAAFQLALEGGTYATCSASQNAELTGFLKVVGTQGQLTLEPAYFAKDRRTLTVSRGENSSEFEFGSPGFDGLDGAAGQMCEEFDYFADCLLTGREPGSDGEHGLADMRTIEAVYEAAERDDYLDI